MQSLLIPIADMFAYWTIYGRHFDYNTATECNALCHLSGLLSIGLIISIAELLSESLDLAQHAAYALYVACSGRVMRYYASALGNVKSGITHHYRISD